MYPSHLETGDRVNFVDLPSNSQPLVGYTHQRVAEIMASRRSSFRPLRNGTNLNLHAYSNNNSLNYVDPSGLDAETVASLFCRCFATREANKADKSTWRKNLPDCPCQLFTFIVNDPNAPPFRPPVNPPGGWTWTDPAPAGAPFHPGAKWCMRGYNSQGGPGQQCCYSYDSSKEPYGARLITDGQGAGTPDRSSPGPGTFWWAWSASNHHELDVVPYNKCKEAGMLDIYYTYRLPNTGKNCDDNKQP